MTILLMSALLAAAPADDFRDKVAPILETKCVRCHGESARKGGLALHSAEAFKTGGDTGAVVEPGKPDESLFIEKIIGAKPEMPKGDKPLSAEEVSAFRRWIEAGAKWPDDVTLKVPKAKAGPWWAVQPLKRPAVPDAAGWGRNPIDGFTLSGMKAKALSPSPEADRRTLIRRLTFDLHGLPPTPEEVAAFLVDKAPDAYEMLVDRLLTSPRYGERWGRHWLDVAHYGDTHGYDKDKPRRNAWRYRDYVIKSLNDDKPYDRFVREQIAGDVLYPGDTDAFIATGFLAAGPWDLVGHVELREGTVDKEKTRLIDRDDMLSNVMSTFTSLTVHCARCHDHKFDPIPQKDYYRLQAVFSGLDRGDRPIDSSTATAARRAIQARRVAAIGRQKAVSLKVASLTSPELDRADVELGLLRQELANAPLPIVHPSSNSNGYHSAIHPTPDALAWVQVDLGQTQPIDEIRLVPARPTDFPDSPGFGFPLRFRVEASEDPSFAKPLILVEESRPDTDGQPDETFVVRPIKVRARYVRVVANRLWKRTDDYVFALSELEVVSKGKNLTTNAKVTSLNSIESGRWSAKFLVDGFDSRASRPSPDDPKDRRRTDLIHRIAQRGRDRARLADALVPAALRSEMEASRVEVAESEKQLNARPPTESVYTVIPRPLRPIRLLNRGDVEKAGELIGPGALTCVPGLASEFAPSPDESKGRAALADWVTDRENPLTWRSIANRLWHHHFGRGIVDTPNDFGRNGGTPTHPELLDWLAVEFRDGGGSMKRFHKLIITSATYRQSSVNDANKAAIDGDNRLLWRQNPKRIEAESVRDAVLMVSGRLNLEMGGPGFEPFAFKDDHSPIYDHEAADRINAPECLRRTVYRFIVRSVPNPFVDCLDGADPNALTPVRNTTITALQALTLLNDSFMIRQSEAFAARLAATGGARSAQVNAAFMHAFARPPTDEERQSLESYAERHGMAHACRLIFNLNEFVFVD